MKLNFILPFTLVFISLTACSPHSGAGKWQAIDDNQYGIKDLSILFEGKAEFISTKQDIATWHCFWGAESQTVAVLNCVPSSDTERREKFEFVVQSTEQAQLHYKGEMIANFKRLPYK